VYTVIRPSAMPLTRGADVVVDFFGTGLLHSGFMHVAGEG
jgi:hypothetical protein